MKPRLEKLKNDFTCTQIIYGRYRGVFEDIFLIEKAEKTKTQSGGDYSVQELFELGWHLFILVKGEV